MTLFNNLRLGIDLVSIKLESAVDALKGDTMNALLVLISLVMFSLQVSDTACITQEELDAEYVALGTYEIQVDEYCEL